jgi:hypothetical protein
MRRRRGASLETTWASVSELDLPLSLSLPFLSSLSFSFPFPLFLPSFLSPLLSKGRMPLMNELGRAHSFHCCSCPRMHAGKTMQCSAFLAGMLKSRLSSRVLIIAPKTLLVHWAKELGVCSLGGSTHR